MARTTKRRQKTSGRRPRLSNTRVHIRAVKAVTAEINKFLAEQRYRAALDLIDRSASEVTPCE